MINCMLSLFAGRFITLPKEHDYIVLLSNVDELGNTLIE